jgi:large-conductance mechanosensitive channel
VARPDQREGNGATLVKKVLGWLVIAFVVFYVIKAPESSAEIVRSAGQALGDAASSLAAFVGSLA